MTLVSTTRWVVLLATFAFARPAMAQASAARGDTAAVLGAVQRLFDGMAARDTATVRALLVPGSQFVAIRGDTVVVRPRVQNDTSFLRMLAQTPERLLERF